MSNWDSTKHPRHPAGSPQGGEFSGRNDSFPELVTKKTAFSFGADDQADFEDGGVPSRMTMRKLSDISNFARGGTSPISKKALNAVREELKFRAGSFAPKLLQQRANEAVLARSQGIKLSAGPRISANERKK